MVKTIGKRKFLIIMTALFVKMTLIISFIITSKATMQTVMKVMYPFIPRFLIGQARAGLTMSAHKRGSKSNPLYKKRISL